MEDVAPPLYMYNTIGTNPIAKKRNMPFQSTNCMLQRQQQQQQYFQRLNSSLDEPKNNWNPRNWEWDSSRLVAKPLMEISKQQEQQHHHQHQSVDNSKEDDARVLLQLGGGGEDAVTRPSKRVRSGSPGGGGGGNYPMCQVDNCKEDLTAAKDYHRRHKVCEAHSKAGKALVGNQMQRFCQQCSRFHPLSEFDEGKRSCRRRLAGHNRRRRKTQPEDAASHLLNGNNKGSGEMNIVNLLTVLARAQGNTENITRSSPPLPNKDQLIQILNKISSLPIPQVPGKLTNVDQESQKVNTMDLLGVLKPVSEVNSGGERSTTSFQSREDSDCQVLDTPVNLQLQLFSSSPENENSPPKLASSRKYFSSDSSDPTDDQSPSSSSPPVAQRLFPPKARAGTTMPFELFGGTDNISIQSSPHRAGYASSGSDQSPSSLNSDPQDRTGRISFKLFDKDPSHLPDSLRPQVYNWLSKSPTDMEGYIRPGCVLLSIYLSMPSSSWDQLEGNFVQYMNSLLQDSGTDFWESGRFLVHTEKQIASYKDGKVHLLKSLKAWSSPQLISISPLAVVAGKETSLILKGRNLRTPGRKIYCTHVDGSTLEEATQSESANQESTYDVIRTRSFKVSSQSTLGRCFIEVENGLKGTSFPIIIADATLCQELRLLESEFMEFINGQPNPMQEILHFLNELGWLFQRKKRSSDFTLTRFKFLLVFSVERDFVALVKTLLGILLEKSSESSLEMLSGINLLNRAVKRKCKNMVDLLIHYSMVDTQTTSRKYVFPPNLAGPGGVTPLHLAACTSDSDDLVDALTNDPQEIGLLSWNSSLDANGLSPFVYASMRNNNSYNTLVARKLANRIAHQVSVEMPTKIELQTRTGDHQELSFRIRDQTPESCSKCAQVVAAYPRRVPGSQGLLHRPYIHSMLAIAAVCVCVCLFLRGAPDIGLVAPFKWENLDFGPM